MKKPTFKVPGIQPPSGCAAKLPDLESTAQLYARSSQLCDLTDNELRVKLTYYGSQPETHRPYLSHVRNAYKNLKTEQDRRDFLTSL